MSKELERAQDMLAAMQNQRDNALNAVVLVQADLAELRRQLTAKQAEADALRAERDTFALDKAELEKQLTAATTLPASMTETPAS